MCARAAANMGAGQVIAIAPAFALDCEEAKQGAAGAQDALRSAIRYDSWREFLATEGGGVLIALSGKDGRLRTPDVLEDRLERLRAARDPMILDQTIPIYLILGPEDDGLSPEELEDAHHVCRLATFGDFFSLNLSHACLLGLYVLQRFLGAQPAPCEGAPAFNEAQAALAAKRAARGPFYYPAESIDAWLGLLGFDLSNRRVHAANVLKRILLENEPTPDELRVLDSIVRQTARKLAP
jgi:tRNA C32,U32 (ribose-2'-O)-methylase TrmJ